MKRFTPLLCFACLWLIQSGVLAQSTLPRVKRGTMATIPTLGVGETAYAFDINAWVMGTPSGNRVVATRIFNGTTAPSVALGNASDYYINTATCDLYQKGAGSAGWVFLTNFKGTTGGVGAKGDKGDTVVGPAGTNGTSATVSIGNVTMTASGTQPTVTPRGTITNVILDFTFPAPENGINGTNGSNGINGTTPTFTYGTTTTLAAGSAAWGTLTGTGPNYTLNLGLPVGGTGATGPQGIQGLAGTPASAFYKVVRGTAIPAISLGVLGVPGIGLVTVNFTPFSDNTTEYVAIPVVRGVTNGIALNLAPKVRPGQTSSSVVVEITAANIALSSGQAVLDVVFIRVP